MATVVNTVLDAFVAPSSLFEKFDNNQKQSGILLLTLMLLIFVSHYWFFGGMTDEYLLNQQLAKVNDLSVQELAVVRESMSMTLQYTWIFVAGMTAIGHLFVVIGLSLFFAMVSKLSNTQMKSFSVKNWFYFASWCQLPWIVNYVGFMMLFASSTTGNLPLDLIDYASVAQLFTHNEGGVYVALYSSMNLFSIWSITICSLGLSRYFSMRLSSTIAISSAPYLIFYGVWFAVL
ncbi:YIP1 family protein [Shewanella sp. HL-SH5]|uniref:YIP1 family protein n=1 Tax=unclassified Shewanella TaxID=196818 RepID=UPI003EB800A8